jgi:competence protein ComGC
MTGSARSAFGWRFTLVELLVVVAIIVMLVALLLPALGRAKYRARVVVCLSQQRQWGQALTSYAADYGGRLPGQEPMGSCGNTIDIPSSMYDQLRDGYGLPHEFFICPLVDSAFARDLAWMRGYYGGRMTMISYGYLAERPLDGGADYFPADVAGPNTVHDDARLDRPVLADDWIWVHWAPFFWWYTSQHHCRDNQPADSNSLWLDGHAENKPWRQVAWKFYSCNSDNYW